MKKKSLALFLSFLLVGCDSSKDSSVFIDAFPVVKEAALSLSPSFGGKRNDVIMSHVCAVADKTESIDEFNKFFVGKNIDLSKLAGKDTGFKMLSNGNLDEMKVACMGYIISSVFNPIPKKIQKELSDDSESSFSTKTTYLDEMSTRIRIAKANAKFFSVILTKAEVEKFDSTKSARSYLVHLMEDSSDLYFNILSSEGNNEPSLKVESFSEGKVSLSDGDGYSYLQDDKDVSLLFYELNWLAKDEVLGKKYMINVTCLTD